MKLYLDLNSAADYATFLRVKSLPRYSFHGRIAEFPDEYAHLLYLPAPVAPTASFSPLPCLFDYQRDLATLAIRKRKFAVFADCGLGKSLIMLEFARHCAAVLPPHQCVLIVSPLMVIGQTMRECQRFYGDSLHLQQVRAADLGRWLECGGARVGITNYEAITDRVEAGSLGALILDESSMLKSHYGRWASRLIDLGRGLHWKLCLTGTPAPNDRIEYANHAVFLDRFPTVNSFLARFFVNRGQTSERWELKPHALRPFYRALSDFSFFLQNPATYGWHDNAGGMPPIHVHQHDVPLTEEQQQLVSSIGGNMFGEPGGITSRSKLSRLAKGIVDGREVPTDKPAFIRDLVGTWPTESTIIWCRYNREQDGLAAMMPRAASIQGSTGEGERLAIIDDFKSGRVKCLISKPDILGFGLNLQVCTRQVFSGLEDSYESYYQAVKRSNRVGSTRALSVHIPVTSLERPMIDTVLRKAAMVERDTQEQERIFKESIT